MFIMGTDKAIKADFAPSQGMLTFYTASPCFIAYPQCIMCSGFIMLPMIKKIITDGAILHLKVAF